MKTNLPVLIVRDNILFPYSEIKIEIDNINDKKIVSLAESYFKNYLFIIFEPKDFATKNELPKLGLLAEIKFKLEMPNGKVKVSLKGVTRANAYNFSEENGLLDANVTSIKAPSISPVEEIANSRSLKNLFVEYLEQKKSLGNSILADIDDSSDINRITDIIASFMPISKERKLMYIKEVDPLKRVLMLVDDLHYELSLLEYEASIDEKVEVHLDKNQKEFILREKLKIINEELGITENSDVQKLVDTLKKLDCPSHVRKRLGEEINRYKLCNSNSPEIGILRNYIDILLSLPWSKSTKDNNNIENVKSVLESTHYGLKEAKERIIEYIATKKHTKSKNNPIICLVGPPGIGKTSLAKAISVALKRKCVKISVGGINDEAEITGHRRAYVGAAPGKIITGLRKVGVNNPVFIIDEIDKMTKDIKGDPASSLLEALDKEQNDKFVDHFVEEEFDLSKVMFILTANYLDRIPSELKDRLEIIELSSYTILEKVNIAQNCLIPKLEKEYNLTEEINLTEESIMKIIKYYTKESGVRELERLLQKMCRKYICHKSIHHEKLDFNENIRNFLGNYKYTYLENYDDCYGVVNALSYHPLGGEIVKIESVCYKGNGNVKSSGQLGEVIQESISLSFAYIKSHIKDFGINLSLFQENDFYIHLPGSKNKKDGPSAGVAIVTSILSLVKQKQIPKNISMTGEISLTGKVLKVGGLKEKIIVALSNGIDTLYTPLANKDEVLALESIYQDKIKFIFVDNYLEIYQKIFKK